MIQTKMQQTCAFETQFWNDSCNRKELNEAVMQGASGATSNPVIVATVIKQEKEQWYKVIDQLISDNGEASEQILVWMLIERVGREAAKELEPVFQKSKGRRGRLSLQINPTFYRNSQKMVEHALQLSKIAPNIAIKVPCVEAGIKAVEELTAAGVCVNVTVSFSVAQVLAAAEAIERGLQRASKKGVDIASFNPYVTMMIGRLDDHLKRVMAKEKITINPGYLEWAGIAAFKKAYQIFLRNGYRSTLLSAAYRNHMQWSELVGGKVVLTMPYDWWTRFNRSDIEVRKRIDEPVAAHIVGELYDKFVDFQKAYDEDGLKITDFVHYGATIHTLLQFISSYYDLLGMVRERMLQ